MSEIRRYLAERNDANRLYRALNRRVEQTPREKFDAYDQEKWEHTYFDEETGGFVVTDRERITEGNKSKNNKDVFKNEEEICKFFAKKGFRIEHLAEPRGEKAPDAKIIRGSHGLITVDGKLAEIKNTRSKSNIEHYAEYAKKKGAKIIIFRFTERNSELESAAHKLGRMNIIHGYYYYAGDNSYVEF